MTNSKRKNLIEELELKKDKQASIVKDLETKLHEATEEHARISLRIQNLRGGLI